MKKWLLASVSAAASLAATAALAVVFFTPNIPFPVTAAVPSPYAFVQGVLGADGTATTATTLAQALPATVTSGNFVGGVLAWDDTGAVALSSIIDDKGNVYNIGVRVDDTTDGVYHLIFWRGNITNAPQTITATFASAIGYRRMIIDEYSGVTAATNPSDGQNGQFQSSTAAPSSPSITTTAGLDLIYGGLYSDIIGVISAGSGFTLRHAGTNAENVPIASEDRTQSAAGAIAATFVAGGGATDNGTSILAVKH